MRHCKVTGIVEWSRAYPQVGDRMVLRVDDFRIFVEPGFIIENPPVLAQRRGPSWRRRRTIWEPVAHRRALDFPAPGSRVAIHCSLGVCEDYVLEELGDDAPDVRADWIVDQIQMELRERVWHGEPGREWAESGHVVRVEDINQMQWDDEGEDLNGVYHLDLRLDARYTE